MDSPLAGPAFAAAATLSALVAHVVLATVRRERARASLSGAVLTDERRGAVPSARQVLQMSPAEEAMARLAMFMNGTMRVGYVVTVAGAVAESDLARARDAIVDSHPFLRATVRSLIDNPPTPTSALVWEVKSGLVVPIVAHSIVEQEDPAAVWTEVWGRTEKVNVWNLIVLPMHHWVFDFNSVLILWLTKFMRS